MGNTSSSPSYKQVPSGAVSPPAHQADGVISQVHDDESHNGIYKYVCGGERYFLTVQNPSFHQIYPLVQTRYGVVTTWDNEMISGDNKTTYRRVVDIKESVHQTLIVYESFKPYQRKLTVDDEGTKVYDFDEIVPRVPFKFVEHYARLLLRHDSSYQKRKELLKSGSSYYITAKLWLGPNLYVITEITPNVVKTV